MVQYQTVQVINVTNLIFTAECLSPSALRKVSRRCHGRANCSVLADTQTFGDPCFPGTRKHLRVSFTCGARRTGCCRFWLTWFAASCKKNTTFIFSSVPRYLLEDVGRGSTDPFLISDFTHGESKAEGSLRFLLHAADFDRRLSSDPSRLQVDGTLAPPTGLKTCS